MLSLESRADLAFLFSGGLLGGSGHHFGALVGASGDLLGVSWEPWGSLGGLAELFGDPGERLWAHFAGPWGSLATTGVHFGNMFGVFGLLLGSSASLLHAVGRCKVLLQLRFGFRRSWLQEPPGYASRW